MVFAVAKILKRNKWHKFFTGQISYLSLNQHKALKETEIIGNAASFHQTYQRGL